MNRKNRAVALGPLTTGEGAKPGHDLNLSTSPHGTALIAAAAKSSHLINEYPGLTILGIIFFTQLLGPFSHYSPIGYIDPWIYTSYFLDWPGMIRRYGELYYGTRVPYIAFGALLYKVFAPVVANVLTNLAILWATCYAIFRTLRRFYGIVPCLVYALALSINCALLQTVLWDYPDGPAIAFAFLGLWFCVAPPTWAEGVTGPLIGGAFYACSGHTMMIAGLIIAPAVVAQMAFAWRKGMRTVAAQLAAILAGAIAATILFGFVQLCVGGSFLFFWPQVTQAIWTLSNRHYSTWEQPVAVWLPTAYRLLTPAAVLVMASLRIVRAKRFRDPASSVMPGLTLFLLLSWALYGYFGIWKNALILQVHYHGVFLLIPGLLYLGFLFGGVWESLSPTGANRLAAIAAGFLVISVATYSSIYVYEREHGSLLVVGGTILAIGVATAMVPVSRDFTFLSRVAFAISLLVISNAPAISDLAIAGPVLEKQPGAFESALEVRRLVALASSQGQEVRFWFDSDERYVYLFNSIASMFMWGNPAGLTALLEGTEAQRNTIIGPNKLFVVLSSDARRIQKDEELLRRDGVLFEQEGSLRIVQPPFDFFVGLLSVSGDHR